MRYNHGDVSLVMCCALQSHETAVQWLVYCAINNLSEDHFPNLLISQARA